MGIMQFFKRPGAHSTVTEQRERVDDYQRGWPKDRDNAREKEEFREYLQRTDRELAEIIAHVEP